MYCWTDSTIIVSWFGKTPSTFTKFVANRVGSIQENVGNHNWYHVRSEDNLALALFGGIGQTGSAKINRVGLYEI